SASDPDSQAIVSLSGDLTGLPLGHNGNFAEDAAHRSGTFTWTPQPGDAPGPYTVSFTATSTAAGAATSSIRIDRAPTVTVDANPTATEGQTFTLQVTAGDLDGDAITSLSADVTGLPPGNVPTFVPNGTNTSATLTWTPTFADAPGPYSVTFTATNAQSGTATTSIAVTN